MLGRTNLSWRSLRPWAEECRGHVNAADPDRVNNAALYCYAVLTSREGRAGRLCENRLVTACREGIATWTEETWYSIGLAYMMEMVGMAA